MTKTKDDIINLPDKRLRQRSQQIGFVSEATKQLADDMMAATLDWEDSRKHEFGVALAAAQLGELYRVVVIRNDFENKSDRGFQVLINPKITKAEGELEYDNEGCLSVKDVYGRVARYPKVKVKALDLEGKEVRVTAEGFLARVLQHEIDHTNGILFVDHVENNQYLKITDDGDLEPITEDEREQYSFLWN